VGSPMSRDDGFPIADIDTGYFDDAKLKDLWQLLRDPARMALAVVLHKATVLASWRQGCRVTVAQACPLWMTVDADIQEALVTVKLLDRAGRLPFASWNEWFLPAQNRRKIRREAGRLGGLASGRGRATSTTDGEASPKQPLTDAEPVRPTVPTVPTDRTEDARADLDAFLEVRFRIPTPAQRTFMDGYCRTFDATGPARAARLILSHPDDPIGALKDDLAAFRNRRKAEAEAQEEPKPRARRNGLSAESQRISKLMREQDEIREQERLERMVAS
jgi:hypothetical protein